MRYGLFLNLVVVLHFVYNDISIGEFISFIYHAMELNAELSILLITYINH